MHQRLASLASTFFAGSPLRHAAYRAFYAGSIGAALGYTLQTTVAAWMMATLTPPPVMVAL
ncbi:MAG TPA: MFS transporter, partial [Casimicrobiaceae bacterium]|nr:MFS transporter [Casimicrobiaceae bacterium]